MYTEKSINLKKDFYARYGETVGKLHFVKVGLPCVILDGDTNKLMFSLKCGVRAYGRAYGDILKVLNSDSNVCDVHFTENGKGAQVLYGMDATDIKGMKETALYAVNKLLIKMGCTDMWASENYDALLCEEYAPEGWCAVKTYDDVKSAPLPLTGYNAMLICARKNGFSYGNDELKRFRAGENERVNIALSGLAKCRTEVLFDMINESQKSMERLLSPSRETLNIVRSTYGIDGIDASRICDCGVICFCRKNKTDNAILRIRTECEREIGYPVRILIVK